MCMCVYIICMYFYVYNITYVYDVSAKIKKADPGDFLTNVCTLILCASCSVLRVLSADSIVVQWQ